MVHSLAGTAIEATNVDEGFCYSKVVFWVFISPVGDVEDVWAVNGGFAGLHVLSKTGMRPSMLLCCFSVFRISDSETPFSFTNIIGFMLGTGVFVHPTFV